MTDQDDVPRPAAPHAEERAFLLRVAELLHAYGTPANRLERVMQVVGRSIGVSASFLSTPTAIIASFREGGEERTHLIRAEPGAVNLGKLVEFDEVMEDVEHGRTGAREATLRLDAIAAAPPRFPLWLTALACGTASAGASVLFGGGLVELLVSLVIGAGIALLGRVLPRYPSTVGLLEPTASFLAAGTALLLARTLTPFDHRIVTLSGLIVLVPGLTLTIGFTELAVRHLVSGTARIAGAAAVFLTMLFGVALAWKLGEAFAGPTGATGATGIGPLAVAARSPFPAWGAWLVALAMPPAFAVLLEARPRELWVIELTAVLGYAAGRAGGASLGPELGPFLGALTVGVVSNLYARIVDRPSQVPMTPGILLLVPGSLGFRSLTSFLDREAVTGVEWAFQTGLIAASLVGGLLAANLVLPPRRVL